MMTTMDAEFRGRDEIAPPRCEECGTPIADDEPRVYVSVVCDQPFCGDCGPGVVESLAAEGVA